MLAEKWGAVEQVLLAATAREEELLEVIDGIGVGQVGGVIVEEILARAQPPVLDRTIRLRLDVTHRDEHVSYALEFKDGELSASPDRGGDVSARLWCGAPELAVGLFGSGGGCGSPLNVQFLWPTGRAILDVIDSLPRAVGTILTASAPAYASLDQLALRYGSDKWGSMHWYTPHYESHLAAFRDRAVRMLEIGIGGYRDPRAGGASLRMWQRYFRRGLVYGLDVFPKHGITGPRLRTVEGDQSDPEFMSRLGEELGPFDIVVDDGSHLNAHVRASFDSLFPYVRRGGFYVIEDLQTSYWPGYGGDDRDLNSESTSLGFLKTLVDGINYSERGGVPRDIDRQIVAVHFYHSLAFIEKGNNVEEPCPSWIPRQPAW